MRRDEGVGGVMMLAASILVLAVACGVGMVFQVQTARATATKSADAAALAGAQKLLGGPVVACLEAARLARSNGATLVGCSALDTDVQVTVSVRLKGALRQLGPLRAKARARLTWREH